MGKLGFSTQTGFPRGGSRGYGCHYFVRISLCLFLGCWLLSVTGCRTAPHTIEADPGEIGAIPIPQASQFNSTDALAMVEFCVDLDNEDDRELTGCSPICSLQTNRIDGWQKVRDSRCLVADYYHLSMPQRKNPTNNGFAPFDSAWTLWKKTNSVQPVYALAFRGTVFSDKRSVEEDAIATTVSAQYGIEFPRHKFLPVIFATLPRAEVHEGFAYAVFSQLFDARFGVLTNVAGVIEPGSTLIITGHSQGAALATLAHAFFYYAADAGLSSAVPANLTLKSYVFAQPKPGNAQFAMDFSRITGGGASSFVFNNTLDPVPMLPPTHLFAAEATEDIRSQNGGIKLLRSINNGFNSVRRAISSLASDSLAGKISSLQAKKQVDFYALGILQAGSTNQTVGGVSQNYVVAGNLIPLRGFTHGRRYYGNCKDEHDDFIQHHATTYRRLLEMLYGWPATVDPNVKRPDY